MKNTELATLNFKTLLKYESGSTTGVQARRDGPANCSGFCVSCEESGLLNDGGLRLDQISHGADTDGFEQSIETPLPMDGVDVPVAFLLESPGAYYGNGSPRTYRDITKQPPINRYYWTPRLGRTTWPKAPSEVTGRYGPYFSYILARYKLRNAYFTNIVKCSLARLDKDRFVPYAPTAGNPSGRDRRILANCCRLYLFEEMRIVKPKLVFYFGRKAQAFGYYASLCSVLPEARFRTLYHPAARGGLPRTIKHNDERIQDALAKLM